MPLLGNAKFQLIKNTFTEATSVFKKADIFAGKAF